MPTVEYLNYEAVDDRDWDLYDEENFERAAELDLPTEDYGTFDCGEGEYILEVAEAQGLQWPFSCRNGVCSNCAAVVIEGDLEMDGNQVLTTEEVEDKQVRLTCIGRPATEVVKLVYNAKQLDYLQDRVMY